jgi:hypothetical protein
VAPPAVPESPALAFESAPELVVPRSRRSRRGKGGIGRTVVLAVCVLAGAGLAVWAGLEIRQALHEEEQEKQIGANSVGLGNGRFLPPGPPWKPDDAIRLKLHANLAMSRQDPSDRLGLFFKDYAARAASRMPREAELIDEALGKLRAYFGSVEWELRPKNDATRLGGQPALVLEFVGTDPEQVAVAGECYILTHRGYGYWFFTWGPDEDKDALAREWDGLRQGFSLGNAREGWHERPRETVPVVGTKAAYRLAYAKGLWEKIEAVAWGPEADLALEAHEPDPHGKPLAINSAHFVVLLLPKAPDLKAATKAARAHLAKLLEDEGHAKPLVTPVKEKGGGADHDTDVGNLPGHLSRLEVASEDSDSFHRYRVLGVVVRPEGVLMLLGDCAWNRRDFWEHEFMTLIDSLRAG